MKVIVDTSVWSLALRKKEIKKDDPNVRELIELIKEGRVQMIGPIRQELLSGIKSGSQFKKLRTNLSYFRDLTIRTRDYEEAAQLFNLCRTKGIQGSNIDFLICAVAINSNMAIFTTDNDFLNILSFVQHLKLIGSRFDF